MRKSKKMQEVEQRFGRPIGELLMHLYVIDNMTVNEVSAVLGVKTDTLYNWLVRYKLTVADMRESFKNNFKGSV